MKPNIMKMCTILTVVVLAILVVAWTAFGQEEGRAERRQQAERARQRFQNISEEEIEFAKRERFNAARRLYVNPEGRQKSIKVIEENIVTLKVAQVPQFEGRLQDLSEEEVTKLYQQLRKAAQVRLQTLQVITNEVASLQGQRRLEGEDELYLIVSSIQLKQIQESATKEKPKETSQLLERLIATDGRRLKVGRSRGERSQGGQRGNTDQKR